MKQNNLTHSPRRQNPICLSLPLLAVLGLSSLSGAEGIPAGPQSSSAEEASLSSPTTDTKDNVWEGPDTSDGFDWIELTSGEWLKGDFKALYDKKLEFDSDKLDLLSLDWEDIRQVVTDRTHMVRSEDKRQFSGAVRIDENSVAIIDADGTTNSFDRAILMSVVEGAPKEINYWSFRLGAGLTVQRGNTEQTDFNISAGIQRRTSANRFIFDYLGLATVINDEETANNHRANASFDIFLSRKFFARPIFGEYYRDRFQNLEHRATVGAGAGYHIIDTSRTEWDVFAGPAYQYTKFTSVQPGESSEAQTPAFAAGTTYDTELTRWMDLIASYNLSLLNERSGTYTHHAKLGVEIEVTDILDLDLSVIWDRVQTPQQRDDGTTPDPDDLRFILGVALDF